MNSEGETVTMRSTGANDVSDTRVDLLASSRAALSSDRRELRSDIALSTVLAVLAGRGASDENEVLEAISRVWQTETLTGPVVRRCLSDGEAAGLVIRQASLDGIERFSLSDVAKREFIEDRAWAEMTLRDFEEVVEQRLTEYDDDRVQGKGAKVAQYVLEAIARSIDGNYAVENPGALPQLRPVSVKVGSIHEYSRQLEPASIRQPMVDIALDAVDPSDEFGNEIVHLVVAGSLLHGVVAQRGLAERPDLAESRVLLDTSSLVVLVRNEEDLDRRVLAEAVEYSNHLGVEVFVAEHSLEEWNRLWNASDEEAQHARIDERDRIPRMSHQMESNPFLSAYLEHREAGGIESFVQWSQGKRNLRQLAEELGAIVRPHGNVRSQDLELQVSVKSRLMELSADPTVRGRRTQAAAEADAHSCAMLVRWRDRGGGSGAFFIATETLTDRVHRELFPDSDPLVINPQAWLLYVANLATDDPEESAGIAGLVADSVVRSTVLSLAGAHALNDVLSMADILTRDGEQISARDIRDLQDESLFDHLERLQDEEDRSAAERASLVLQRRSHRSSLRARRAQEALDQRLAHVERSADSRVEAETKRARDAEERATASEESYTLFKRRISIGIASALVIAAAIALLVVGWISPVWFAVTMIGLLAAVIYAWEWLTDPSVGIGRMLRGFAFEALLIVIASVMSLGNGD